ncbi:MAG: two-component sensor histidine kinase [Stappia sp.]|uniref:sensor histidine kinase n=1 Tax=Stappia sp. TaxID=1870903 RepID=UPI000C6BD05F|nr:HAMP domain-containing sensor histidine kinase [Stappia sp.]MAA97721.1 two-component sensor histidine kinase [Stappia sp.]MBM20663.1 two-component sensor histidine kinase [Stappia sp.]|tara:strand:+ start:851 stop:2875 length:2025 start_codon:yes stop_codon:yes gene_type:complete
MAERPAGRAPFLVSPIRSVRFRLLAIALLPTLVLLPLFLGVTIARWSAKFDDVLKAKVNGDLTIAHQYMARILENTGEKIDALGRSAIYRDVIATGNSGALAVLLEEKRAGLGLDFLHVVDRNGRVVAAAPSGASPIADPREPVLSAALGGEALTAIDIFAEDQLGAISPALAERARLPLIATPNAVPTDRETETRGMVVYSAAPAPSLAGNGALVGGILLNQNLVFIDTINDLVYRSASLPEGSQGTATLFLDDVRISTNVRLFENRRALGTRVSAAVREAVLGEGQVWLDSAFVVNDWYISAYEPIVDSHGKRVGMLYVGFLERPFFEAKYVTLVTILGAFLLVALASVPLFLRWAGSIFRPLEHMTETIARVEAGELGARTALPASGDEISRVALHLDHLLDLVQQRDRQLRSWNDELNARVAARTEDLEDANRQLEATTRQLIMSEKLAAIGEITAGVAHEINNPIAVMQGNLEVLRSLLGEHANIATTEIRLIDEQISRIHLIVTKLLQFAKPEEYAGYADRQDVSVVVSDCLPLVKHLLKRGEIEVSRSDTATMSVLMNRTELQQVIINLMVNALHAMPDGGELRISTLDQVRDDVRGVCIRVSDTGRGMTPEVAARIFDPFFTTKRQQGTGLGLSISQTLVTRQGGSIEVESAPDAGTTFTIWLPAA